jgi:hypothetical protein
MANAKAKKGIYPVLLNDMEAVFVDAPALTEALGLTIPTWNKIKDGKGASHSKISAIIRQFFEILLAVEEGKSVGKNVFPGLAKKAYAKYRAVFETFDFEQFICDIPTMALVQDRAAG